MLKIYTTLFILIFSNLSAEIVQRLEVKGAERFTNETIKVYGEITIGKDYSPYDINQTLKNLYNFLQFQIHCLLFLYRNIQIAL